MSEVEKKAYFVYGDDCEKELERVKESRYITALTLTHIDKFLEDVTLTSSDHVVVMGSGDEIKEIFDKAHIDGFSVGLISLKIQSMLRASFEIPSNLEDALEVALNSECQDLDLLYANGKIVLWNALIGEAPPIGYRKASYLNTTLKERYTLLVESFKNLKTLKKTKIKLITDKDQEINTSASGIVVIEHDNHTFASALVQDDLSPSDGRLSALLVSPTSIVDYLQYLYISLFKTSKNGQLPNSVGFIKTSSLSVESSPPLMLSVDGREIGDTPVKFEVKKQAIRLKASEEFWIESKDGNSDKETIKLSSLPTTSEGVKYVQERLPFFTHASEDKYRELFAGLREQSKIEPTFVVLMILSTILATVGLFLNSASVVIGAMLLAPLMQPIVSSSMGVLRSELTLFLSAIKTTVVGVFLVLLTAAIIALLLPFENLTSEIAARLRPSLLDLMVALASGVAAAYAKNNEKIIGSLAGVAIAVALVPPLATAGIGLGWMRFDVFYQAFLLFLTNFVGIIFAGALTFLVMGFSPIKRAKKGLTYALVISMLIAIPLYLSFKVMVVDSNIRSTLEHSRYVVNKKEVKIENVTIKHSDGVVLRCDFIVTELLEKHELKELKLILQKRLDVPIILEVVQRVRLK